MEPARPQVDDQRSHGHAEHRDGDGDERKVIPHRHAENPRQRDLIDDRSERKKEEANIDRAGRTRRGQHASS